MAVKRWMGARENPIELVAYGLLHYGGALDPAPPKEIADKLWSMGHMVAVLMGGCPEERHTDEKHDEAILRHRRTCRMTGPKQWYIFKLVNRGGADYPVFLYNLAGPDGGYRPLDMGVIKQIEQIQSKSAARQIEDVIERNAREKAEEKRIAHDGILGKVEEHAPAIRKELDQFNLTSVPTDAPGKSRKITNLYRNERTAAE